MATYVHIVNESDLLYSLDYLPQKHFDNRHQILIVRDFNLDKPDKLKNDPWFNNLSDAEKRKFLQTRICKMDDKPYGFGVIFRSWLRYSNSWINREKVYGLQCWCDVKEQVRKFKRMSPYAEVCIDKSAGNVKCMKYDDIYIPVDDDLWD